MRFRTWLPSILLGDGDHHIRHRHVLRREECRRYAVHIDSSRFLVHHRYYDHIGVSLISRWCDFLCLIHAIFFYYFQIWRHGTWNDSWENRRRRLFIERRIGNRTSCTRNRLQFQPNLPSESTSRQA